MVSKLTRMTDDARISELLGLPEEIDSSAALVTQAAEGFPAAAVDKMLGILNTQPSVHLVPDRALRRAKLEKVPLSPAKSRVLYDFARAYVVADRFYNGNGALIMRFMEKPNPELGGAVPLAIAISSPAGADAVIDLFKPQVNGPDPDPHIQASALT